MRTMVWLMTPFVFATLTGCVDMQGFPRAGKMSNPATVSANYHADRMVFSRSVTQEISAMNDYISILKKSPHASSQSMSQKDRNTLKSIRAIAQEGKNLQKEGASYRALQKIRTAKRMMNPMMKRLWKLGETRANKDFVARQMAVFKQRQREVEGLTMSGKIESRKVGNARGKSKKLFGEAKKLRKNGMLRRAYAKNEDALDILDTAIAIVWRDRRS